MVRRLVKSTAGSRYRSEYVFQKYWENVQINDIKYWENVQINDIKHRNCGYDNNIQLIGRDLDDLQT